MRKPLKWYKIGKTINVRDKMQSNYSYTLTAAPGDLSFKPYYSPAQMLKLGVFEGKYLNDCFNEFPAEWYSDAADKLRPDKADVSVNLFGIKSRLSLAEWKKRKWIPIAPGDKDIRGWFQWYCRYWLGRRIPEIDHIQIARWSSFVRHSGQIKESIRSMSAALRPKTKAQLKKHRPRQRQALLQWAHNPWVK